MLNQYSKIVCFWRCGPTRAIASSNTRFLDHTQRRTTVGRTPLDEWSARRRDLHLTTHNTHNRQTSMSPVGFEPTISAGERVQTYALDRATTGTDNAERYRTIWMADLMTWCQDQASGRSGKSNYEHRPQRANQDAFNCSIISQISVPSRFMFHDHKVI